MIKLARVVASFWEKSNKTSGQFLQEMSAGRRGWGSDMTLKFLGTRGMSEQGPPKGAVNPPIFFFK